MRPTLFPEDPEEEGRVGEVADGREGCPHGALEGGPGGAVEVGADVDLVLERVVDVV